MIKRANIFSMVIFFLSFFLVWGLFYNFPVLAEELNTEESDDLFAVIVEFVVERDPALKSQQSVIEAVRRLDEMKPVDDFKVPDYAQSSLLQVELDSLIQLQQAQQTYTELKKELISSLSNEIIELLILKNKIENQTELHGILIERMESIERQVQAGIIEAESLWQLSDKIIEVQTSIADSRNRRRILRRKIAFNYGGTDWEELLELLRKLEGLEDINSVDSLDLSSIDDIEQPEVSDEIDFDE